MKRPGRHAAHMVTAAEPADVPTAEAAHVVAAAKPAHVAAADVSSADMPASPSVPVAGLNDRRQNARSNRGKERRTETTS